MDNELNIDLDQVEAKAEEDYKVKNRYKELSEKNIFLAKEKEEVEAKAQKAKAEAEALARERDFYKDFSAKSGKYPGATELQDKIWEKVKLGYETEDAMVAVLNKEGKLSSQPVEPPQSPAEGGSSQTVFPGEKTIDSMTSDEKFAALQELEKSGDLANLLRGGR